jgi:hypothetical protein
VEIIAAKNLRLTARTVSQIAVNPFHVCVDFFLSRIMDKTLTKLGFWWSPCCSSFNFAVLCLSLTCALCIGSPFWYLQNLLACVYGSSITWLNVTEYCYNKSPRICSVWRNHNPITTSYLASYWACNKIATIGTLWEQELFRRTWVDPPPLFVYINFSIELSVLSIHGFWLSLWYLQTFLILVVQLLVFYFPYVNLWIVDTRGT